VIAARLPELVLSAAASGLMLWAAPLAAPAQTARKTGAALASQLEQPAGISWQERPLDEGLERLAEVYGVAIFLDRRIDPDQFVNITIRDLPLRELVAQLAVKAGGELSRVGPVLYIGPQQTTRELATVAALRHQDLARLPTDSRSKLLRSQALSWPALAQPARLVEQLAREAGLSVDNLEAVPHDLWPAVSLPPLTLVDRLTVVLAGFGLTYQVDASGQSLRLATIPTNVVLEKRYRPPRGGSEILAQLRSALPRASIQIEQGQIIVQGKQEDHEQVERMLAGPPAATKAKKGAAKKLYSLNVENQPTGNVLKTLSQSLGKELKYDESLLPKLRQPVTFDLKDATLERLLETTLSPVGLTYEITETELIVRPAR
jgi:hypothetical protein